MSTRNIAAHVAGALAIIAGGAWLALDVKPDGHVERSTAIGVALLVSVGWFLIDKKSLADFAAFVWAQVQRLKDAKLGGGA